ncbi:hypothetical protein RBH26_12895 [Natronolimnohabitans sp. A-GB9]|uniref:DUF7287 family protein n=1 Tax=Natronolimnohabitans sp. A-GB9 TaxID=3069757 RepID=UPI0027ADC625|nr:hypothetical protein [Natronolimnohabitans sp. A-GB9]MDQ2051373.1 hypothetical protein [Natronolimnohabitans sp. A-GB9]
MTRKHNRPRTETEQNRRPRTVSVSLRDRGQTTQDFAVGIGVFILAVAFVFSFLPTILTPFDSSVSGGETAQADRIADRVVDDLSASTDDPNEIDVEEFESYGDGDLATKVGLRSTDRVNVRLEPLDGTSEEIDEYTSVDGSDDYDGQSAASAARLVVLADDDGPDYCTDEGFETCRLVVRVW